MLALAIDGILTLSDSEVNTFRHYFAVILVTHLQLKELDDGGGPCIGRPIRPSSSDLEHLSSTSEPGNFSRSERRRWELARQRSCSASNLFRFCESWWSGKATLLPAKKYGRFFGRTIPSWNSIEALTLQWRSCARPSQTMPTILSTLKRWRGADTD